MISSDPDLDGNHMLVRINEVKGDKDAKNGSEEAKKKCLVSVAEREHAPAANSSGAQTTELPPNYFSVGPTGVGNPFVNEFVAPFQGLEKVREAHGNWAAAELALEFALSSPRPRWRKWSTPLSAANSGQPSKKRNEVSLATIRGSRRKRRSPLSATIRRT